MTTRLEPNPPSPYADADPNSRHMLPGFVFAKPQPGALAPTGCLRLAVVPDEPLRSVNASDDGLFPEGMCEDCIRAWYASMEGRDYRDDRPFQTCTGCGDATKHEGLCALCRQEAHDAWRTEQQGAAAGGDQQ